MSSEVLSWREESWWERKSIPIASHSISPRLLFLVAIFGGLGEIISLSIPPTLFGIAYLGKAIPVLAMFAIGMVLGSRRIKTIPIEFQLIFKITQKKDLLPSGNDHSETNRESAEEVQS